MDFRFYMQHPLCFRTPIASDSNQEHSPKASSSFRRRSSYPRFSKFSNNRKRIPWAVWRFNSEENAMASAGSKAPKKAMRFSPKLRHPFCQHTPLATQRVKIFHACDFSLRLFGYIKSGISCRPKEFSLWPKIARESSISSGFSEGKIWRIFQAEWLISNHQNTRKAPKSTRKHQKATGKQHLINLDHLLAPDSNQERRAGNEPRLSGEVG